MWSAMWSRSLNLTSTTLTLILWRDDWFFVRMTKPLLRPNDGTRWSWVLNGEQPLRKKGQGRGIHQSDVICSTVGWLADAGESLEYGKNHEGFWTGEMFVHQVRIFTYA